MNSKEKEITETIKLTIELILLEDIELLKALGKR